MQRNLNERPNEEKKPARTKYRLANRTRHRDREDESQNESTSIRAFKAQKFTDESTLKNAFASSKQMDAFAPLIRYYRILLDAKAAPYTQIVCLVYIWNACRKMILLQKILCSVIQSALSLSLPQSLSLKSAAFQWNWIRNHNSNRIL